MRRGLQLHTIQKVRTLQGWPCPDNNLSSPLDPHHCLPLSDRRGNRGNRLSAVGSVTDHPTRYTKKDHKRSLNHDPYRSFWIFLLDLHYFFYLEAVCSGQWLRGKRSITSRFSFSFCPESKSGFRFTLVGIAGTLKDTDRRFIEFLESTYRMLGIIEICADIRGMKISQLISPSSDPDIADLAQQLEATYMPCIQS